MLDLSHLVNKTSAVISFDNFKIYNVNSNHNHYYLCLNVLITTSKTT